MQTNEIDANAAREALERVLASDEFSRSERLSSFLSYVCTSTLEQNGTRLTEQHIGTQVFGRPEHYLPVEDTIVRTTAGLLRKRLAKYYETEGSADPVRIAIPRGSYVPIFVTHAAVPEPVGGPTDFAGAGGDAPIVYLPGAPLRLPAVVAWLWSFSGSRRLIGALGLGACVLVATVCAAFVPAASLHDPVDRFWQSVLAGERETLLVPADSELVMYQAAQRREIGLDDYVAKRFAPPGAPPFQWRRYTSTISVTLAAELGRLSASAPQKLRVRYARDLQLSDLKHSNVVLVGIQQANPWVHLFRDRLNYHIDWDAASDTLLVRNDKPAPGEQALYTYPRGDGTRPGFAVITYTHNLSGDGNVLIVGGTSSAGTEAAIDFLLNRDQMRDVLKRAVKRDGTLGQFEVMLECVLQATGSTDVKILGVRTAKI